MIRLTAYLYRKLILILPWLGAITLLMLRLGWGFEAAQSGHYHLDHYGFPAFIDSLTDWKVPHPQIGAVLAGTTEMVCGVLIMLGIATRLAAIPFTFNFAVAMATTTSKVVVKAATETEPAVVIKVRNLVLLWQAAKQYLFDLLHIHSVGHVVKPLLDDYQNLTSTFTNVVNDTAFPFFTLGLTLMAFGPGLFSVDGIVKTIDTKCPKFSARVGAFAYRWEATIIGLFLGIFAGYPLSYYAQPASIKNNNTLSDYLYLIGDMFRDHAARNKIILVWSSTFVGLVTLGVLIDVFLLKRKPVKPVDVQPAIASS